MSPPTIPLLRVRGDHREAGRQVGEACATIIRTEAAFADERVPWTVPRGAARAGRPLPGGRGRGVPWYREELEGIAEGADADPRALFAAMTEEIWYEPYAGRLQGRCSDLVAVPPATSDGAVLVAHNNDMPRSYQDQLVAIEWRVDDPVVLTIGNGLWISTGWSSAGLSFTGNELALLDERIGIPREIQFRSMLRQPTMADALREGLREDRASSYNNVIASWSGDVVNIEGSATDAEQTGLDGRGTLVHTNHYVRADDAVRGRP